MNWTAQLSALLAVSSLNDMMIMARTVINKHMQITASKGLTGVYGVYDVHQPLPQRQRKRRWNNKLHRGDWWPFRPSITASLSNITFINQSDIRINTYNVIAISSSCSRLNQKLFSFLHIETTPAGAPRALASASRNKIATKQWQLQLQLQLQH